MSKSIEFLKLIGVPEQTITALESADETTDITGLVEETETHFTTFYKEKVKDEIHKQAKGSAFAEAKTFVKKVFGLTEAEVKELDLSAVLKLAHDRLAEKTGNKEATDQINSLRQQLIDFENKVKSYEEETIPSIKASAESEVRSFKIGQAIQSEVMKHSLVGTPKYVVPGFISDILKKYKVELSEDGTPVVTHPDGGKVFGKDKKELSLSDIIILEGKESKIFAESNGNPNPTPIPTPAPPKPSATNSRDRWHQDAEKRIEAQKAKAGI